MDSDKEIYLLCEESKQKLRDAGLSEA